MQREVADHWSPCPEGEIQRMVARTQRARRNRTMMRVASAGAVLLLVFTAAVSYLAFQPYDRHGGLACAEVIRQLPAYQAGTTDAELTARIAAHLENCPYCRQQHQQSFEQAPLRDQAERVLLPTASYSLHARAAW